MNLEGGFISKQKEEKNWKTRKVEKLRALRGKVFFPGSIRPSTMRAHLSHTHEGLPVDTSQREESW